jgi:hypothetical protein
MNREERIDNLYAVTAWALDLVRALNTRPIIARLIMRFAMGKYAYRELIGLIDALDNAGFSQRYDNELENLDYHEERMPLDFRTVINEEGYGL